MQNDAISDKVPVATLLRKVLVLASNLDSDVLEEWVRFEMNGYTRVIDKTGKDQKSWIGSWQKSALKVKFKFSAAKTC
ncbi:hypothetical protein [Rhizobium leguminosarum]|uniref:AbiTii domain-containing protein n=1 Tax=Rhizobium leguminosarum TaxID=384 RepID=UPI0039657A41